MSNATRQVISQGVSVPQFTIAQRKIKNHNQFQFYVLYGETAAGPWAKIGLNDQEYILGFVPKTHSRRPSRVNVVPIKEVVNEEARRSDVI